jgi:adenosylcobinamide kinase/adenosylcobinamide-phosphate guanylyltransferase
MPSIFISGPVRSGKSRFAERLARESGGEVTYVATGPIDPGDAEWEARVAHHRGTRPAGWRVIETSAAGAPALADIARRARPHESLLVDSLGTWLAERMSRRLADGGEAAALDADALEGEAREAVEALLASNALAIVVCDEVGWGLVPEHASGRVFRDVLGRAHQLLAAHARDAYCVVAGYALDLRALGTRI